ncbi:bifunctional 5-dehydro-2-deoxygluconokinase/5-dehydro-2-deoxyphosphogluconate aldolase [Anaeromyxobacter oryzae]|uniref:5-dehydro-2-deoxygluconokinase n=1 Tax=Anaeromyxobacter oryzae TaxID=2918170 RepID=A0ABN6MWU3_9BACT|nr:5-dehydro-2-deoxygluconokinase [Anaeromyxobacter oryzae]BDG05396.1 5-dehydro-2-deoxygluconokinase [Anaeromyxobacter oryzae]
MATPAHPAPSPAETRRLDVICLGRLAIDLYAQQLGAPLADATTFARYLGGSSANIAFGCARLGLRAAMASRVGDDPMGRFLCETLAAEGCDVSHVSVDPERLTALVLLGIKDRETFPLVFYRRDCADMAVRDEDVEEPFVASSRALVVTGTHLSTEHTHAVAVAALERARRNDVRTVLDVDYRPVLWGLTKPAAGDTWFVASDRVTAHLQALLPRFDLVVGTRAEFRIAGGRDDLLDALRAVRALTPAVLVVKLGAAGCAVVDGAVPPSLEAAARVPSFPVKVMNELGAGDAFMAGLLKGWLDGRPWAESGRTANACGALVVSRHACSASMPTPAELDWFVARPTGSGADQDPRLARLHRVSHRRKAWDDLCIFAFDHRRQLFDLASEVGAPEARLRELKSLFVRAVGETEGAMGVAGRVGAIIDDTYGEDALLSATGRGWWLARPVEVPGSSPLELEGGRSIGSRLVSWPREQVVKCLVRLDPDGPVLDRLEDETQVRAVYDAVQASGHELLLEVIPPGPLDADRVLRALKRLYNVGIFPEWWKLPPLAPEAWGRVDALVAERDPSCRGALLLGQGAALETLAAGFRDAAASRACRGFAVGRTIFDAPSREWLAGRIDDDALVARVRASFEALIRAWRDARAGKERAA